MKFRNDKVKRYYSEWWENPKDIRNAVFNSLNEYVRRRIPGAFVEKHSNTFFATPASVIHAGGKVIFADVKNLCIDLESVKENFWKK